MTDALSVIDIELEGLREVDEAENREESHHDQFEALPAHTTSQETEPSTINFVSPGTTLDADAGQAKAKPSCTASTAIGTWVGASFAIGALVVAIYYGYWSLRLQRWSALKDFKSQCQEAEQSNVSTPECVAALALPPMPPPVAKRVAQRLYDCVAFRPGCSGAPESDAPLSQRSVSSDGKPWWLLIIQTLALLISVSALAWLQSIPPDRLRGAVHFYLGDRGMLYLRTVLRHVRIITWETCLFLSCFSPLYAVWFWWMFRKRMRFSSIVALTYLGGAFSVYYVYGSRVAGSTQRESRRRSWRVDAQSVEQQVWTRPDGVHVTKLQEDRNCDNDVASAVTVDFQSGRRRRHR